MSAPPKIENAPGLKWKRRRTGWDARWQCRDDLAERGFKPKSMGLLFLKFTDEIHPRTVDFIQTECGTLQADMLVFGRGGIPKASAYDGTYQGLMDHYMSDPLSDFHECRYFTRKHYRSLCKVMMRTLWKNEDGIEQTVALTPIAETRARHLKTWHRIWSHQLTKLPMGHACMTMLRTMVGFGVTILEDEQCVRLSTILGQLSFPQGKSRTSALSAEQVIGIRGLAPKRGFPSIALAQAMQFEFTWRQKDLLGEWVPISEKGHSEITDGNNKWLRGIRWNEIDENLVVRHVTSKKLKLSEPDIKLAPMVIEELNRSYPGFATSVETLVAGKMETQTVFRRDLLPVSGPVIVAEGTELPWQAAQFRLEWRDMADELGIPKNVKNMDTRAGAITEALDMDASVEKVRKTATHSNASQTEKYSRADARATAQVMQIRAVGRVNKA